MAKPETHRARGIGGQSDVRVTDGVGGGRLGSLREISGETCRRGEDGRSQSLRSTGAAQAERSAESKVVPREGGQEGGDVSAERSESRREGAGGPVKATQASSIQPGNREGIDRAIGTERMLAALDNGDKGNNWFSLIDKVDRPQTLMAAWQQVKVNKGAAGIDGQSIERFAADAERYLGELAEDLKEGRYRAAPVRRVEIPKAGGQARPQGIPTVKDRNVQAAVKRVIEPIFEKEFLPTSYGFRPGRGGKDALREVDEWLKKGYTHVVDADLNSYFDSIPHARLKERLKRASAG